MSVPEPAREASNQISSAAKRTRVKAKTDPVSVVSALALLALPVTFIGLNFWSASFARISYQIVQPLNHYLEQAINYEFFSIGRVVWLNLLCICFVIVVHEVGHVTAGLMAGFDFEMTAFGPLRIDRAGKISFGMDTRNVVFGFAKMDSTKPNHSLTSLLVLGSGGMAANLLCGSAIFFISAHPVAVNLVFYSVAAGLSNLIPYRYLNVESDGRTIYALLFERDILLSALSARAKAQPGSEKRSE